MSKSCDILFLRVGDYFQFSWNSKFRNLQILHISDSGVSIKGEENISDDKNKEVWRPLSKGFTISAKTSVKFIKHGFIEKKKDKS